MELYTLETHGVLPDLCYMYKSKTCLANILLSFTVSCLISNIKPSTSDEYKNEQQKRKHSPGM